MLVAHHLARQFLQAHSSKFSRHDFTLPQLFASLYADEVNSSANTTNSSLGRLCICG